MTNFDLVGINKTLNEIKDKIKPSSTSFTLWLMGWFFTIGYIGLSPEYSTCSFWEKLSTLILSYILWPIVLGMKLSGRSSL